MLDKGSGLKQKRKKVSAEEVAAALALDGQAKKFPRPQSFFSRRGSVDRDGSEALPSGHPVSWGALWQAEAMPRFPGLMPMGMPEMSFSERLPVVY